MSSFVFLGPSLARTDAEQILTATYLPPVAMGDIYQLVRDRAAPGDHILIIDGVFEQVPAVWHKEILFALSRGIHVYGASSMGALRAAELSRFGMQGIGKIFEQYHTGEIIDDDEVAVSHSFSERGFTVTSEAMVNIRSALAEAVATQVIDEPTANAIEATAKATFYPDRVWPTLLEAIDAPAADIAAFKEFLRTRRPNQKREDAITALHHLAFVEAHPPGAHSPNFHFEETSFWVGLTRTASGIRAHQQEATAEDTLAMATQRRLKSDTNAWQQHRQQALLQTCVEALGESLTVSATEYQAALVQFCRRHKLQTNAALTQWLAARDLTAAEFKSLITTEAKLQWLTHSQSAHIEALALCHSKCTAHYPEQKSAALAGVRLLNALGITKPSLEDTELTASQLQDWFENKTQQQLNFSEAALHALGYSSPRELIDEMIVQYLLDTHGETPQQLPAA